jgi:meiotically up-regulated gene 157 (Mug157) protein
MTGDSELACLLRNTLPNTLDTTVRSGASVDCTLVITGDITAMWLRDSTNQVLPYLPFASSDSALRRMLTGLLRQQTLFVLNDPYANAFYLTSDPAMSTPNTGDQTTSPSSLCVSSDGNCSYAGTRSNGMKPGVYERKYELDSLMAFLKLSRSLYEATGELTPYDAQWLAAVRRVLSVLHAQQASSATDAAGPCGPAYTFTRNNIAGQGPLNSLLNAVGPPAGYTGMVRSAFRPSDDACMFSFLVPANAMAVVELRHTARLARKLGASAERAELAQRCETLAGEIDEGIRKHGVVQRPELGGTVYAYEVDGFGNANMMDDANVPSLLSMPYLGFVHESDQTYVRTRD